MRLFVYCKDMASMGSEKPKSRIKNLSTRFLKFYKFGTAFVILSFIVGYFVSSYYTFKENGNYLNFLMPLTWLNVVWIWLSVNSKVFHVEFDDEFLYVIQKNQDILIPLENIKDVEIVSLGGVYKITLYAKDQLGDLIYFKPSLLYPFNFKSKDKLVDVLRHNIDEAKKKVRVYQRNALYS
jgi:hypothetical protein